MKFFDSFKQLTHSYDEEYEVEETGAEPEAEESPRQEAARQETAREQKLQHNRVVNIHATAQLQVVLVKPDQYENCREIADHLREKRTVVLNLESTNREVARRLLDFISGVAYAQDGKLKKIAANTFIITPYNVDLMGDIIDELENNGLYF